MVMACMQFTLSPSSSSVFLSVVASRYTALPRRVRAAARTRRQGQISFTCLLCCISRPTAYVDPEVMVFDTQGRAAGIEDRDMSKGQSLIDSRGLRAQKVCSLHGPRAIESRAPSVCCCSPCTNMHDPLTVAEALGWRVRCHLWQGRREGEVSREHHQPDQPRLPAPGADSSCLPHVMCRVVRVEKRPPTVVSMSCESLSQASKRAVYNFLVAGSRRAVRTSSKLFAPQVSSKCRRAVRKVGHAAHTSSPQGSVGLLEHRQPPRRAPR